jgi:hypothetical protein
LAGFSLLGHGSMRVCVASHAELKRQLLASS